MGTGSYSNELFKSERKMYKKMNIYARDLTLAFEGDDKHTTYSGATITTGIMTFIIIYSIVQLEVLFKRTRTTVNFKTVYEDLTKHYCNYSLNDYGFYFEMQLSKFGTPVYNERY